MPNEENKHGDWSTHVFENRVVDKDRQIKGVKRCGMVGNASQKKWCIIREQRL